MLLAFLLASAAFAGPKDYCMPVASLTAKLSSCTDNEVLFADAAVACLDKFGKDADTQAEELRLGLVAGAGTEGQGDALDASRQDLVKARARVAALLVSGHRALKQVAEYRANLALPEDFESAPAMGYTVEEFLGGIPCYEENRKVLLDVGKELVKKLRELENVQSVAQAYEKQLKAAKADARSLTAAAEGGLGESAVATGGRNAGTGASDITGTDRKPSALR